MGTATDAIRVLLVDDEPDFLRSTEKALTRRGFRVVTATGRAGALAAVRERGIDVAILDVRMPDVDGHDLFYELRAEFPRLGAIMLTGHGDPYGAFATARDGVFAYLMKPCDLDDLAGMIRGAVGRGRLVFAQGPAEEVVRVLAADGDAEFREDLARALTRDGMRVLRAADGDRVLEVLRDEAIDVAVIDVQIAGSGGLDLVAEAKRLAPRTEFLLLADAGTVDLAVAALKLGAFDFLVKPQAAPDLAAKVLRAARAKLHAERELLGKELGERLRREWE
jgi:DNA-binding NtrC family response regulator